MSDLRHTASVLSPIVQSLVQLGGSTYVRLAVEDTKINFTVADNGIIEQ